MLSKGAGKKKKSIGELRKSTEFVVNVTLSTCCIYNERRNHYYDNDLLMMFIPVCLTTIQTNLKIAIK